MELYDAQELWDFLQGLDHQEALVLKDIRRMDPDEEVQYLRGIFRTLEKRNGPWKYRGPPRVK